MRAGILTFHRASNYGTALQAYATAAALRSLGVDAQIIDYRPEHLEQTLRVRTLACARSLKEVASIVVNRMIYGNQIAEKYERFKRFFERMPCSERICRTMEEVQSAAQDYDVLLSGSDQLWNERITGDDLTYFLPFAHPYKISYASSFGVRQIDRRRSECISPLLADFKHLAMREETARQIVKDVLGQKVQADMPALHRVVDPTLLLTAQEWKQQMADDVELFPDGYILTYYMIETPVLRAITKRLQQQTGLPVVNIKPSKRQMLMREGKNMMWAGPAEFLRCYAGAKYVVTNSFHGTAFAINFGIPFYVAPIPFSRAGEVNARLVEILSWYEASDRFVGTLEEAESIAAAPLADGFKSVCQKRREESLAILKDMLQDACV